MKNKKVILLIISYIVVIAITIYCTHYYDMRTPIDENEYTTHASNTFDDEDEESEEIVYIAPYSGTKYHLDEFCRGLSNAREVESMSLEDAELDGYEACDICN